MNKHSTFIETELFREVERLERRKKIKMFFKKELPWLILFCCVLGAIFYM